MSHEEPFPLPKSDSTPPDPLALSVSQLGSAVKDVVNELDGVHGSIKGIHKGIGDMHSEITDRIGGLETILNGLASDVRTALSVVPRLRREITGIKEHLGLEETTPAPNGADAQ